MAGEEKPFRGNAARAPTELAAWLAGHDEVPLEPDLPILDPHIHLWNGSRGRFLAEEFREGAKGHNVRGAMFVQCYTHYRGWGPELEMSLGETEWVVQLAEHADRDKHQPAIAPGIVAFADLRLGSAVRPVLEQHREAAKGRLKGIRHGTQFDASSVGKHGPWRPAEHQMADPAFRKGFAELGPMGLTYDAWLFHPQIPEFTALARTAPETVCIIDHVGGPLGVGPYAGRRDEIFATWKASMAGFAALPNTRVKVGGLGMIICGFGFSDGAAPASSEALAKAWKPYVETVIELFGVDRCMFESNFPVDNQSCSYGALWNAFKRITADCSAAEKRALYLGTAAQTYKLPDFLR